ncbi:MAG: hypothetical protein SVV80_07995 [Planctomycetota bacterium]|nr:hypothetical protein [Planctomycetota bacterium]
MNVIDRTFQQLYGQLCWGVHYDRQLNLSMNFGDPHLKIRELDRAKSKSVLLGLYDSRRLITVRGRWWLWIYCSYWKISYKGKLVVTGASSIRRILQAAEELKGQKLVQVDVNKDTGATRFVFDLGGVLDVRRFERNSKDEIWILYKPNGYVLSVSGNGTYDHGAGTIKRPMVKRSLFDL